MAPTVDDTKAKASIVPPLVVTAAILVVYVVYFDNVMVPALMSLGGPASMTGGGNGGRDTSLPDTSSRYPSHITGVVPVLALLVGFHILFGLFIVSFIRSITTRPGTIPYTQLWKDASFGISPADEEKFKLILNDESIDLSKYTEFIINLPVVERKKKDNHYRFCTQCEMYKPDRTHHCRVCNKCILRMDHHCPWIANCVGFMNYKFFLLFVVYGVICCIFILLTTGPRLMDAFRPVISYSDFVLHDIPVIVISLFCLFIGVALTVFGSFHIYLTASAMSTIELREKKNVQETKHRFTVAHLKFDKGFYRNLITVLGPPYMWLIPIQPNTEIEGTYCPRELQDARQRHSILTTTAGAVTTVEGDRPSTAAPIEGSKVPNGLESDV